MGAQWKHAGRVTNATKKGALVSKLVKEIMKHKPDLTIQNNEGENALKIASELYKDFVGFDEESKKMSKIIKILKGC